MKTGRNQLCPCGSGEKFKHCCIGKVSDFSKLTDDDWARSLSIRGKNIAFINMVAEILQFNNLPKNAGLGDLVKYLKKAITPKVVRDIHLIIPELWPDGKDLHRCLVQEKAENSGLFLGSYLYDVTVNLLNRHAMYNQSIILIDPFNDYRVIAPEYSPVEKPHEHITTTFHYILLWFQLLPWIEAGIVKIIRDPGDFDYSLRKDTWERSRGKADKHLELKNAFDEGNKPREIEEFFKDQFILSHPEEFWVEKMKDSPELPEDFVKDYFRKKKEDSLYYVDVGRTPQLLYITSGANYEMGKYICDITNSHIITDLSYRWKEMELDRKINGIEINAWSTFAKAFQESDIKHFHGLDLHDLLRLRKDGYLDDMRSFLRRVWNTCSSGTTFSTNDVDNLTAELHGQIAKANAEWDKIDSSLVKWFGSESVLGASIGVSLGTASWVPAAAIAGAGVINLVDAKIQRRSFLHNCPAGFFIDTVRNKT